MKLIATILLVISATCSYSQVRNYYLAQDFPTGRVTFTDNTDLVEITGVSFTFVKTKLNSYLKTKLKYDRIGNLVNKINDSTFLVTQRFKQENDPEINPKFDFLEFKYKTHLIENDTVVERIDVVGSEAMIGEFYRKYWNQELNVIVDQDAFVVSENKNKNDLIQLIHQPNPSPNSIYSAYSISITPGTEDFKTMLSNTKAFVKKRNAEKRKFDQFKASTVYHMANIDTSYYKQISKEIASKLRLILLKEENITGTAEVYMKADTLGRTWVSVTGKNARINLQLRDELNTIVYNNQMLQGYKMTTEDTYTFDYSFIHQNVDLVKKPGRIVVHTDNYPELEDLVRKEAMASGVERADMTYNTSLCIVNNEKSTIAVLSKVQQRGSPGKIVAVIFLAIFALAMAIFSDEQ